MKLESQTGSTLIIVMVAIAVIGIVVSVQSTGQRNHIKISSKVGRAQSQLLATQFFEGALSCKHTMARAGYCNQNTKNISLYNAKGYRLLKKGFAASGPIKLGKLYVRASCAGTRKIKIECA